MTPQKTTEALGIAMGLFLQKMVTQDLNDPDFWKEAGIDQVEFAKGIQDRGAHVDIAFTFSTLTDLSGDKMEPLSCGITGNHPEMFFGEFSIDKRDLGV